MIAKSPADRNVGGQAMIQLARQHNMEHGVMGQAAAVHDKAGGVVLSSKGQAPS